MNAIVECYAGHRYPERPRAFWWEGKRLKVGEIERRWRTPAGLTFCVRSAVDDGSEGTARFILTYREAADTWEVRLARLQGPRRHVTEGGPQWKS